MLAMEFEQECEGKYLVLQLRPDGARKRIGYVSGRSGRWHAESLRGGKVYGHARTRTEAAELILGQDAVPTGLTPSL